MGVDSTTSPLCSRTVEHFTLWENCVCVALFKEHSYKVLQNVNNHSRDVNISTYTTSKQI